MGFKITSRRDTPSFPIEISYFEDFPGGGTLDKTGLVSGVLQRGVLGHFNEATRLFQVLSTLTVVEEAAADATTYKVAKMVNEQSHLAKVGTVLAYVKGGKSYAVTAIDSTNADYDVITLGTSLGVIVPVGGVLFESATVGAATGALKIVPNGWLREDADVDDNEFISVGRRGTLYERRLPFAVPQTVKDELKGLIVFSQQR